MSETRDFPAVRSMLLSSAMIRALDLATRRWALARAHSSAGSRVADARERLRRASPADRVRAAALAAGTAAAGHLILLQLVPAQVAPQMPRGLWLFVAAAALVAAVSANAVVSGWNSSLLRRLTRRARRVGA